MLTLQLESRLFRTQPVAMMSELHIIVPVVVIFQLGHRLEQPLTVDTLKMFEHVTSLVGLKACLIRVALLAFHAFHAAMGHVKG